MATLPPVTSSNDYQPVLLGTAGELSLSLHAELEGKGYSLIAEEVWDKVEDGIKLYAAYATFEVQLNSSVPVALNASLPIYAHEWAHIETLVRAECDLIQATRMEADRSTGMEGFGLDVNTATSNRQQIRDAFPHAVYVHEPEMIELE